MQTGVSFVTVELCNLIKIPVLRTELRTGGADAIRRDASVGQAPSGGRWFGGFGVKSEGTERSASFICGY